MKAPKGEKAIEPLSPFPINNKSESLALGKTLYRAVELNDLERIERLIQRGAALNWSDEHVIEAASALKCAARFGKLESLNLILSLLPDDWPQKQEYIDDKDEKGGATALDLATWYGHGQCVDALLEAGANVTYNLEMDMTTSCYAINSGRRELIIKLLKIEFQEKVGDSLKNYYWNELHEKILYLPTNNYPFCKLQIASLFQKLGLKTPEEKRGLIGKPGPQLITAMHLASVMNPAVLQYFLELGADPKQECAFGKSAVHFACGGGDVECASLLSEFNATKQPISQAKLTPLLRAVRFNRKELVKFFLLEGHPLIGKELNYAAGYCDVETVSLFIHQISEPTTLNGLTSVATALTFSSDPAILDYLAEHGAEVLEGGTFNMYYSGLRSTNYAMIEKLFEISEKREMYQGWDLLSKHGQAFLYSALSANREDIAILILKSYKKGVETGKFIITEGFENLPEGSEENDLNSEKKNPKDLKPFFAKLSTDLISLAVVTGLLDVVEYLHGWGADLNTQVREYNLLTIATMNGDSELVYWLNSNGAKPQPGMKGLVEQLLSGAEGLSPTLANKEAEKKWKKTTDRITNFLVQGTILFICSAMTFNIGKLLINGSETIANAASNAASTATTTATSVAKSGYVPQ